MTLRAPFALYAGLLSLTPVAAGTHAPAPGDQILIITTSGVSAYEEVLEGARRILGSQSPSCVIDLRQKDAQQAVAEALRLKTIRVVLTIGSESAQTAVAQAGAAPVIATTVLPSMFLDEPQAHGRPATMVPAFVRPATLLDNLKRVFPNKSRLGIIHNSAVSKSKGDSVKAAAEAAGFTVRVGDCAGPEQLLQTFLRLKDQVDIVLCFADPVLYNSVTVKPLVLASLRYRLPLIGFSESFVRAGAVLSVYPDFHEVGSQAGELTLKALNGQSLPRIEYPRKFRVAVNHNITRLLGLSYTQQPPWATLFFSSANSNAAYLISWRGPAACKTGSHLGFSGPIVIAEQFVYTGSAVRFELSLLLAALVTLPALSADWEAEVRALRPSDTSSAQAAVLDELDERARHALYRIHHATTKAEADSARPALRRNLAASLGFRRLPWPPDLRPSITDTLQREGYRIQRIVFQSLPDTWVPAHLYLPGNLHAPAPAVLFYNGHWWPDSKARPDFQAFCINMARLGFVVFSFDPFGQGERGVSSRDHRRTEALLVGVAQQGIAEYETRCALEYLLSRPEVDRTRIGMTGASGGGYNTWITGALDDRISVVVPVVGTSEFYEQIHVTRPLDWYHAAEHCHYVPGLIQYANNHEFVAMVAPRPLLIIAASQDQSFPIAGVHTIAEYGRDLYRAFGAGDKVGFFEDKEEGHGYQKAKREAAYGWFLRWLMHRGDGRPMPEPPTRTEDFPVEKKLPAGPGIIQEVRRLAAKLPAQKPVPVASLMGELPAWVEMTRRTNQDHVQRVHFRTQPGIDVPAFVSLTGDITTRPGVLVALDDRGKEALVDDPIVAEARRRGWTIWGIDPRGIGELETPKSGWAFAVSLLLGENFVWRQGWDIRRILDEAMLPIPHDFALYARGHNAALAATYALAMPGDPPVWAVLRDGFTSYRQFIDRPRSLEASYRLVADDVREQRKTAFDREIPHEYFPFRALESPDLPQLRAASKSKVYLIDPIDGDWEQVPGNSTLEQFLHAKW